MQHLYCKPEQGFFISSAMWISGFLINNKEVITLCLQWTSFIIAIFVGVLTIIAKYRDLKKKADYKYKTKNKLK